MSNPTPSAASFAATITLDRGIQPRNKRAAAKSESAPRRLPLCIALAAALSLGLSAPVDAATRTWTGAGGTTQWSTPKNWNSTGSAFGSPTYASPVTGDFLVFNSATAPTQLADTQGQIFQGISFQQGAASFTFEPGSVIGVAALGLNNASGKTQVFNVNVHAYGSSTWVSPSATPLIINSLALMEDANLTFDLGVVAKFANQVMGVAAGETTRLNVWGGSSATMNSLALGGTFGSLATLQVRAALSKLTTTGDLVVGQDSTGTLEVQAGGSVSSGNTFIGKGLTGDGQAKFNGATTTWASTGNLNIGEAGFGSLLVEAGAKVSHVNAVLGNLAGSAGAAKITGANSAWTLSGDVQVGNLGQGTLNIEAGGHVFNASSTLGAVGDDGSSSVTVTGNGSRWTQFGLNIVSGKLSIADSGVVSTLNTALGRVGDGGASSIALTGAGSRLEVGNSLAINSGLLSIADGASVGATNASFATFAGTEAVVDLIGTGSSLTVNGVLRIGGSATGTATPVGAASLSIGAGATLNSMGSGSQLVVQKGGILSLNGGTLNVGFSSNAGLVNLNTGTLNFLGSATTGNGILDHNVGLGTDMNLSVDGDLLILAGDLISLNGGQAQSTKLSVRGDLLVGNLSQFSVGSGGLLNTGSVQMSGGTISSVQGITSSGYWAGYGVVSGAAGFLNTGLLQQGDGGLTLSNTGVNINTGTWEMQAGRSLSVASGFNNEGALKLNGGTISGGMLVNAAVGTISGSGRISSSLDNRGSLVVNDGLTQVDGAFVNRGQILLGANLAALGGGQVSNLGLIQGLGKINSAVSNANALSVIEAQGGTLTLNGAFVGANSGILAASSGAKLLITQGLASNAGKIQLAGGTLDNNGVALVNEAVGTISGFGTLRGGLLTNKGQIQLTGGPAVPSAIYNSLLASDGSKTIVTGNANATFYGTADFQSGSELRVSSGAIVTFFDMVQQRTGTKFTGSGAKRFDGGITVGASPGLGTDEGDVEFGESNFYIAEIGGLSACTLACGTDAAVRDRSFDKYSVAGSLMFGGELRITSWNGFVAQAGQRFDLFDWGTTTGTFSAIDASGFKLAAGTRLDTSALYTTGEISVMAAVPEPETYALLIAGLGVIGFVARRRRAT